MEPVHSPTKKKLKIDVRGSVVVPVCGWVVRTASLQFEVRRKFFFRFVKLGSTHTHTPRTTGATVLNSVVSILVCREHTVNQVRVMTSARDGYRDHRKSIRSY